MADWWDTDAADPTHPALLRGAEQPVRTAGFMSMPIPPMTQQSGASGWWSGDVADPEHPFRPTPTVAARSQNYAPAELSTGMPTSLPGIASGLASSLVMGPMQTIAHGIEAMVPPQTATPASKVIDTANQKLQQGPAEYQLGRGIGTMLAPLAVAPLIPGSAVSGFLPRLGVGAATGAGFGAATPVDNAASEGDYWRQKALQTGIGGALGGAVSAAGSALFGSRPQSADVQLLRQYGIEPPPGAARGGLAAGVENAVGAVPILGAPVQYARRSASGQLAQVIDRATTAAASARDDLQRNTINGVLGRFGESLHPDTNLGYDAVGEMADKISQAYQRAIPQAGGPITDKAISALGEIESNAKVLLPADRANQFSNFLQTKVLDKIGSDGTMSGQAFKDAESDLGRQAASYFHSGDADQRTLGGFYQQTRGALRDWLADVSPENAAQIQAANQAYREGLVIQDAAARAARRGDAGQFTPKDLLNASITLGGKKLGAQGNAPLQDVAQAGSDQQRQLADAIQALQNAGKTVLRPPRDSSHGSLGTAAAIEGLETARDVARHGLGAGAFGGVGALAALPVYAAAWLANTPAGRATINNLGSSQIRNLPVGPLAAWLGARQIGGGPGQPPAPGAFAPWPVR